MNKDERRDYLTQKLSALLDKMTPRQCLIFLIVFLVSATLSMSVLGCAVLATKDDGQSSLVILPQKTLEKVLSEDDQSGQQNPESNVGE